MLQIANMRLVTLVIWIALLWASWHRLQHVDWDYPHVTLALEQQLFQELKTAFLEHHKDLQSVTFTDVLWQQRPDHGYDLWVTVVGHSYQQSQAISQRLHLTLKALDSQTYQVTQMQNEQLTLYLEPLVIKVTSPEQENLTPETN